MKRQQIDLSTMTPFHVIDNERFRVRCYSLGRTKEERTAAFAEAGKKLLEAIWRESPDIFEDIMEKGKKSYDT